MTPEAPARVEIKDFQGMATDIDPHDAPSGLAVVQVNLEGMKRGQAESRRGYRKVRFEA